MARAEGPGFAVESDIGLGGFSGFRVRDRKG